MGIIIGDRNPCPPPDPDNPCVPAEVFWLESNSINYVLKIKSKWIFAHQEYFIFDGIKYFFDDEVEITGIVSIWGGNGKDFELEIETIRKLPTNIEDIKTSGVDFSVYPNPNDGNFTVRIEGEIEPYTLELLNTLGGQLGFINCNENYVNINRADLSVGIYFVKLTMNGKTSVKKIVVQ
jgi:hypothetical protein